MVVKSGEVWGAGAIYGRECGESDQVQGIVDLGSYLKLVFKLDSAWNSKGLGRLVERLGRGMESGICGCVCGCFKSVYG